MKARITSLLLIFVTLASPLNVFSDNVSPEDSTTISTLLDKAKEASVSDPDESINYTRKALAISLKTGSHKYIGACYNAMGIGHEIVGNIDSSIYYYEKALGNFEKLENAYLQSSVRLNLSQLYFIAGKLPEAFSYALTAKQKLDSLGVKSAMLVARSKLAFLSLQVGDYDQAIKYRTEEMELAKELNDTFNLVNSLLGLNALYYHKSDIDSAEFFLSKAEELFKHYQSPISLSLYYKSKGNINTYKKNYTEAINYYHKSIKTIEGINDFSKVSGYVGLLHCYIKLNKLDSANYYAEIVKEIIPNITAYNNDGLRVEIYTNLVELAVIKNDYEEAYKYLKHQVEESEESFQKEYKVKLAKVQLENELDQSKQDNMLLTLQRESDQRTIFLLELGGTIFLVMFIGLVIITIRANRQKKEKQIALQNLKQTSQIKDGLLEIISHDLRSPLSSLAGLVNLSNQNLLKPEDARPLFSMLESTMDKSLNLADNLLIWSKFQGNEIKLSNEEINLEQTVNNTIKVYASLAEGKGISLKTDLHHTQVPKADLFMINLIIRNLLSLVTGNTNSGGNIHIKTEDTGNGVKFTLVNTHHKLATDKLLKWKANAPFGIDIRDKQRTMGLGLYVADRYLQTLGKELDITSSDDSLIISFTLPC